MLTRSPLDYFEQLWHMLILKPTTSAEARYEWQLETYMFSLYTTFLGLFCSAPWLILSIPGVGPWIHQMRPTGFDEGGGLKLVMTLQQMKRKQMRMATAGRLSQEETALLNTNLPVSNRVVYDKEDASAPSP